MTPKDNDKLNTPESPEADEDYSLEEILAEYGGSLEHQLLRSVENAGEDAPPEAAAPGEASPAPKAEIGRAHF